jgi:biopolymer transport protein ExbD
MMLGVCLISWQTYGSEWGAGYLWRQLDLISRLAVFVLGIMLAYVVVVVSRGSYRYHQALGSSRASVRDVQGAFLGNRSDEGSKALAWDLSRGAETLKSIASTAPYLGLAGTCFGILESFRGAGMARAAALAMITTYIAASLVTTASGVLVALSAIVSYRYLFCLVGELESRSISGPLISSRFPLRGRFAGLPAFALIAAPSLAIAVTAFMTFSVFRYPKGLEVHLLRRAETEANNGSPVQPIIVEISGSSLNTWPEIYVNSQKTELEGLDGLVWNALRVDPRRRVYVEAGKNVRWADVATVIDTVKTHSSDVVLLTIAPEL